MMFKPLKHPNVRILEGVAEFVGKTGVIIDKEGKQYRVRLDEPVEVPGVGTVTHDLWMPAHLKVIRPPVAKVAAPAAPEAATVAAVEAPALQPAPAAETAEAATPAQPAATPVPVEAPPVATLPTIWEEEQLLADMTLSCQIEAPAADPQATMRTKVVEMLAANRKKPAKAKSAAVKKVTPKVKAPKASTPHVDRGAVVRRKK
jgi:hypothetical protein